MTGSRLHPENAQVQVLKLILRQLVNESVDYILDNNIAKWNFLHVMCIWLPRKSLCFRTFKFKYLGTTCYSDEHWNELSDDMDSEWTLKRTLKWFSPKNAKVCMYVLQCVCVCTRPRVCRNKPNVARY